jgi:large subunit ribosomal protein L40e
LSFSHTSRIACTRSPHGFCLTALLMWWAIAPEAMAAQIFVLYPNNRQIGPFEVELFDSIDSVKALVEDRLGAPPDRQYLYYGSRLLLDGRTLSDYDVQGGSTLPLVATWPFSLPLPPLPLMTTWAFGISNVSAGAGTGWTNWPTPSVNSRGTAREHSCSISTATREASLARPPAMTHRPPTTGRS